MCDDGQHIGVVHCADLASELRALWRDISRDDEAAAPAALHVDGKPTSTDVEPAAVVHSSLRKRHVHQSS